MNTAITNKDIQIPLVFTTSFYAFEKILSTGKILSKEQLRKLRIPFEQHTSSYVSLEHALGTFDDVTLFIDPLFRSDLYGGMFNLGPRIIFDRQILYQEGVFMLPMDQGGYYDGLEDKPRESFPRFEQEKMRSSKVKDRFIDDMKIGEIMKADNPLSFKEVPCPEVHIPREVALHWARAFLIHTNYVQKYQKRPELEGKIIVPFHGRDNKNTGDMIPDSLSLLAAYKRGITQQ